jgi:hypothetical protein
MQVRTTSPTSGVHFACGEDSYLLLALEAGGFDHAADGFQVDDCDRFC